MHIHINHNFCTDSNWGGVYWADYMVSIPRAIEGSPYSKPDQDWRLLKKVKMLDQKNYDNLKKRNKYSEEDLQDLCMSNTLRLDPKVFEWLENNVADVKKEKGFCVGTDNYNFNDLISFTIFFVRKSDALRFIKIWSQHKKPTTYFDYFKEIRKQLNLKTNKLETVDEFTYHI
jgi:hypothetical protein